MLIIYPARHDSSHPNLVVTTHSSIVATAPKYPKKSAKKVAEKAPIKAPTKKGVKAPFMTSCKVSTPKTESWTQEAIAEPKGCRAAEDVKNLAIANVTHIAMLTACTGAAAASP
jgi:hypothetical protein